MVAIDGAGDLVAAGQVQGSVDFGRTTLDASPEISGSAPTMSWIGKRSGLDGSEQWTVPLVGEGIAIVLDPNAQPEDKVVLAGQGCPTQAITIMRGSEKLV